MFWFQTPQPKEVAPPVIKAIEIPPVPLQVAQEEKEELVREYCASCMTPDGEIKCPRRHRCKTCHCYLTDEEWFQQKK